MAGAEVTTDILFLQKRESLNHTLPSWVNVEKYNQDININSYFIDHPDMILGEMQSVSGPYGMKSTCIPYPDRDLETLLKMAVLKLSTEISPYLDDVMIQDSKLTLPADPNVKNFSFCIVDDDLYYRENTVMFKHGLSLSNEVRVKFSTSTKQVAEWCLPQAHLSPTHWQRCM